MTILKSKKYENLANGATATFGYVQSNMEIWCVTRILLFSEPSNSGQTAVFKNQIDWVPLSTGSVRPTQGRTLAIAQVSGGSQSFNTVNSLRLLGRWMRMFTIPNQSSIPKAYTQFTSEQDAEEGGSRLMPSDNRDRVVDCMEEFVKYSLVMKPHFHLFGDRFSERSERVAKATRAKQAQAAADQRSSQATSNDKQKDKQNAIQSIAHRTPSTM